MGQDFLCCQLNLLNKDTFRTDQWWVIHKANKDLGVLDLTFATPQDSLWKVNSFFLVIPERAFYCPNFLLDLQHLRTETLETSDAPSAHNAASEAWDHLPEKKKTQWNLFTVKTSCYPEMWELISNQFSRYRVTASLQLLQTNMTLDSCCCPSYLVSFAFELDAITNMLQSRNSTIATQPITFNSGF